MNVASPKVHLDTHLDSVAPGATAHLSHIAGEPSLRRRLLELGLLPGTAVRVVRRVVTGDLVEVEVRGCFVSLRRAEARNVFLLPDEPS